MHNLYIVMEFVNGGDMASLLQNVGYLDEQSAVIYVFELSMALEYLYVRTVASPHAHSTETTVARARPPYRNEALG